MPRRPPAHVAFVRGINLGKRHKLPMAELKPMFEDLGCVEVRTYIASGNVVFRASAAVAADVADAVAERIAAEKGFEAPVMVRSARKLASVVEKNPYAADRDPKTLHVSFLERRPTQAVLAKLDPERGAPDTFEVVGQTVYLCVQNGMHKTKIGNDYFERTLKMSCTLRNWRTVNAVLELARG